MERTKDFGRNSAAILAAWADYVARGGLARPPSDVPDELLDLEDRVTAEVPALIGVTMAIYAAGQPAASHMVLSLSAKATAKAESPIPVANIIPLATAIAKWAGANRNMVLRGMGCITAMTLQRTGSAEPPSGLTVEEMVRDGAAWIVFPGENDEPTDMEKLGSAMATYVFGEQWTDLVGMPSPELFTDWAGYLYGGGLDRPIASVHFSLLGGMGIGGKLIDSATASSVSAAICLAAHGYGDESTKLLSGMELAVKKAEGDVNKLSATILNEVGPLEELALVCGKDAALGCNGCFTALALWQVGLLQCLDPHHTLRKMAMSRMTRFSTGRNEYAIGEFSMLQDEILRELVKNRPDTQEE